MSCIPLTNDNAGRHMSCIPLTNGNAGGHMSCIYHSPMAMQEDS